MPKKTVLLADDDPGMRHLVEATLGGDDFRLLHASDGMETLSVARRELPDLVLLDVNMPKVNGLEVCRQLKLDPASSAIKVVMLTASSSDSDRARGRAAGADDYFVKPFSPVALLNKVWELLG
jgi:two-component system, OmpR family, phosphate regulon response regulator PhoB